MEHEQEQQFIEAAVRAFREQMSGALAQMRRADSASSFAESERLLHSLARQVAGSLTERIVQEICSDEERRAGAVARVRARAAKLGITLRSEGRRTTEVRTLGGQLIRVEDCYLVAAPRGGVVRTKRGAQGTGVYPTLDMLGIAGRSTPALRLQVAHAVCEANSVESARDLLSSGGTEIDYKAALRLTYMVTEDALAARAQAVAKTTVGNDAGEFVGHRIAVAVDGGRVCVRRRVAGRPRNGGRKRFVTEWREPKVLTIYVIDAEGKRDRRFASVTDGTLGDADALFALVRYHLLRVGGHRAREVVFLGDAAPWIWNRTDKLRADLGLPLERFTEVVDWYHVVERLTELAKSRAGWSEEEQSRWLDEQRERLVAGEVERVQEAALSLLKGQPSARETEEAYWLRNRDRVRYDRLLVAKLPIGSGAVESAVRRVVNLRLKGASIVWTEEHAEGVLHLRAFAKSGRWTELEQEVLARTAWRPTARSAANAA